MNAFPGVSGLESSKIYGRLAPVDVQVRQEPLNQPSIKEILGLVVLFALFLAVNLSTSTRFPRAWYDEVQFVDPAANLYFHDSFTTTTYSWARGDEFHSHHPLYSFVLAGWFELTGFGLVQSRTMNYVLMIAAAVLMWLAVVRSGLVPSTAYRLVLVALMLLPYSTSFPYRAGRLEPLMMVLSILSFLIFTIRDRRWRMALLAGTTLLFAPAGLHLVTFTGLFTLLILAYQGKRVFPEVMVIWCSLAISVAGLFAFYAFQGVWDTALHAVTRQTDAGGIGSLISGGAFRHFNRIPKDPSLLVLVGVLVWVVIVQLRRGTFAWRSMLSFGLVSSIVIPVVFVSLAKFPSYNTWMVALPASVCICATLATMPIAGWTRLAVHSGVVLTCLAGLPLQLAAAAYDWQDRDHARAMEIIAANVRKDDWAICDSQAYFAVKPTTRKLFGSDHVKLITLEERRKITLLVGSEKAVRSWREMLGGEWVPTAGPVLPQGTTILQRLTGKNLNVGLIGEKYDFVIYRRQSGSKARDPS